MRMRTAVMALSALVLGFSLTVQGQPAWAQRPWVSGRNPCSGRMLGRYYGMLEANPADAWPLTKLLRCVSLKGLVRRYEKRITAQPKRYNFRVILGTLHMRLKQYAKAVKVFQQAKALNRKSYITHYRLGDCFRRLKQPNKARLSYEKALGLTSVKRRKKTILRRLIDLTVYARTLGKARAYFKALLALEPRNRLLRLEFAQVLTRHLRYQDAIAEYRKLIKRYRGNSRWMASLYKEIGGVYEKMGKDPDAKKSYEKAMRYTTAGHYLRLELTYRIIAIYRRKNDLKSLIAEYERKWRSRGYFQYRILASLYDEIGNDTKAIKAYRAALRIRPRDLDTRNKLIALFNRLNRHQDALRELERMVRIAPDMPRFQLELAQKLWGQRKRQRALAVLARLGRRFRRDASVHLALADYYNKWGKPKRALKEYQILVRIEPGDYGHLINLGEQYWQRGNRKRALATWKRLLRRGMFRARDAAYATLANTYAEHDLNKEAISYFKKALKLKPKRAEYQRGLAMALQKARRFDDAVAAWQKVIVLASAKRHQSWRREARTAIIDIWHRRKILNSKLAAYRQRFGGRPPDLSAGYFLGEAFLKLKKGKDAEKTYLRILEVDRNQVEALLALEQLYRESYRLRKAIAILKRLIEALPQKAREYHSRIAVLYLQILKDEHAIRHAMAALKLAKNDATGWARLGAIYEKKEDWPKSIKAYRKALELNNRLFKIHFALARIYLQLGRHVDAVKLYHEVVRRSPDVDFVRQAARRAIDIDEYLGNLLDLERDLIPLAFTYTHKKIYRKSLVRLYERLVPRLAFEARFEKDAKRRRRARQLLKQIGQRALKPLLEALSEKKGTQRDIAIDVLGYLGNPNAAPPLVRLALEAPDEEDAPKPKAVPRYGRYRRYRHYRPPVRKTSAHTALKVRAIVAAGRLGDPRTAPDLTKLLADSEVEIREAAAWALSGVRHRSAIKPLTKALNDPKIGVEIFACLGLGRQVKPPVDRLIKAVQAEERREEVRAACAFGLGLARDKRAVKLLLRLVREGPTSIRPKAAWALGFIGDGQAVAPLATLLWSVHGDLQRAVAWALLRSASGKPMPRSAERFPVRLVDGRLDYAAFLKALKPRLEPVGAAQVAKVLRVAGKPLASGLDEVLQRHRDLVLRVLATLDRHPQRVALGPLFGARAAARSASGAERLLAPLNGVLKRRLAGLALHRDADIRAHALRLVAKVDLPGAVAMIEQGLRDRQAVVRRAAGGAAVIVAARKPARRPALVRVLTRRLDSLPWHEQLERLARLGQLRAAGAIPALRRFARKPHGFLAQYAIRALGHIGSRRVLPDLLRALRYPAAKVRIEAIRALVRVDRRAARSALRRLARTDPSAEVRQVAKKALR